MTDSSRHKTNQQSTTISDANAANTATSEDRYEHIVRSSPHEFGAYLDPWHSYHECLEIDVNPALEVVDTSNIITLEHYVYNRSLAAPSIALNGGDRR